MEALCFVFIVTEGFINKVSLSLKQYMKLKKPTLITKIAFLFRKRIHRYFYHEVNSAFKWFKASLSLSATNFLVATFYI